VLAALVGHVAGAEPDRDWIAADVLDARALQLLRVRIGFPTGCR
jgi:hypothetical protein